MGVLSGAKSRVNFYD